MLKLQRFLKRFRKTRNGRLSSVASSILILLFVTGCAATTSVSEFCLRDRLIPLLPGEVVAGSVTETEILVHNYIYDSACSGDVPDLARLHRSALRA